MLYEYVAGQEHKERMGRVRRGRTGWRRGWTRWKSIEEKCQKKKVLWNFLKRRVS